jgi:Cd2+/Zn2+-exporting ATPase
VRVGSPAWLEAEGVGWSAAQAEALDGVRARGRTVAGVAREGELLAWIGLADEVRPHAREALAALRTLGVRRLVMLTGDHRRTGDAVAAELGLDEVHAELRPEDKVDRIAALTAAGGPVVMIGDGVNDAPALALADVGVAMGAAGTRAALETAPVALMGDDLRALPEAVRLSRATVRVVRQNLAIALGTVAVLVAGVLAGRVHMAGGMLVHQASVLAVIVNALRLARGRAPSRRERRFERRAPASEPAA